MFVPISLIMTSETTNGSGNVKMEKSEKSFGTGVWFRLCPDCGQLLNKRTGEEKTCGCGWIWR